MANQVELEVTPREAQGKAVNKRMRKEGILPANIFGHNEASQAITVNAKSFDHLRRSHAATSVIALRLPDGAAIQTALIRRMQRDPRSGKVIHVDFFRISMSERINVKVALHLVGEAPAVKIEGGVLLHLMDTLEVECIAGDIPESLDVDISGLVQIDDMLHAEDVQLPPNFVLITDPKEGIAKVAATRAELAAETAEVAEEAAAATPAATEE